MTKKLNQKGFSLVEGLLVIIALALIVFVGYYVYHAQNQTNKTYSAASKEAQSAPAKSSSPSKPSPAVNLKADLESYLLDTCSADNASAIKSLFSGQTAQTAESDSLNVSGDYAIVNVTCDLKDSSQLTTEILKHSTAKWNLLVDKPTSISCSYLTDQGFPDSLKAPYCSNGVGGEGNF